MLYLRTLCLFLFASHVLAASILPITDNPIPVWADPTRDVCDAVRSCDDCQTGAEYCKYLGQTAHCCSPPPAEVKPIEEDPIPSWASASDVCTVRRSCDDCADDGTEYCTYVETQGEVVTKCCAQANGQQPIATGTDDEQVYTAAIIPIQQDPIPSWASATDVCMKARSCDDCQDDQYCRFTKNGNAKCCGRSAGGPTDLEDEPVSTSVTEDGEHTASILPITEDPIPSWASASDVCTNTRSCDACDTPNEYCKYTPQGDAVKVQCCARAPAGRKNVAISSKKAGESNDFVASIVPVQANPIPEWASRADVCMKARSCDECQDDQYCRYSKHGHPKCCGRSDASAPAPATISPITENPIPSWAAADDTCVKKKSCDYCSQSQYCKYTASGRAQCCSASTPRPSAPVAPATEQPAEASITPITENPIPSWASEDDMCIPHKSCDHCHESSYCKYNAKGAATCCSRPAGIVPSTESPIPTWASKSDICLEIRSCDSCQPSDQQYCHYTKKGKAKCCTRF